MAIGRLSPALVPMPADAGAAVPPEWSEHPMPQVPLEVDGIPFVKGDALRLPGEGATRRVEIPGARVRRMHVLGGGNSVDFCHPAWGGVDTTRNFFLGDSVGELALGYEDGTVDTMPLMVGHSVWWRQSYRTSPEPFASDPAWRGKLGEVLRVANGLEANTSDAPSQLCLELRDAPLAFVELRDSPARIGHALLEGFTFSGLLAPLPETGMLRPASPASPAPAGREAELASLVIDPADSAAVEQARGSLLAIEGFFSGSEQDINDETIATAKPQWGPHNFQGPKLSFEGDPIATILTRVCYDSAAELVARVMDDGMVRESKERADRFDGFGGWTPDLGAYAGDAYTRNRSPMLLATLGRQDLSEAAILFFDKWLMCFPQSWPELQLDGKPVPAHITVVANQPHVYFDLLSLHGWPTRYETRDFGNPENDGHGIQPPGRYRAWTKSGRSAEWVNSRWEAIEAAAECIPWCLDNPDLSFSEHGLLYNESEAGMGGPSYYCDIACRLGLPAYAEMSDAAGRPQAAERWREQAARLLANMDAYYKPLVVEGIGEAWDPSHRVAGSFHHGSLAALVLRVDYWGFDAINRMPEAWRERTRNTLRNQLRANHPSGASPGGMGYGQNYIAQSALLLDEMAEAGKLVGWLARACFAPRLEHPYRVPEGLILREGATTWRRWGDLGNLYHPNQTIHTSLMIAGVDDVRADRLLLMPRPLPSWSAVRIEDYPARVASGGDSVLASISYDWERQPTGGIAMAVRASHPIDRLSVRLGPFPPGTGALVATVDGVAHAHEPVLSGDSLWAWVEARDVAAVSIEVRPAGRCRSGGFLLPGSGLRA